MTTLPDVPGRFHVGATTFAIPISDPVPIGKAKLNPTGGNAPNAHALLLEEVAFTAYYPVAVRSSSTETYAGLGMDWTTRRVIYCYRPVKETLHGYAHVGEIPRWFTRVFSHYAARLKVPVRMNAPLLDPVGTMASETASWPLVIFSHGLGGSRTNYSQLCSRIAAAGNVVLSIEHRDGTAPAVVISNRKGLKEATQVKLYLRAADVTWEDGTEPEPFALRLDQLHFRRLEVYLTYKYFSEFVSKRMPEDQSTLNIGGLYTIDGPSIPGEDIDGTFWRSWLSTGNPKVQFAQGLHLVGHSFGGATIFSILSNPPPQIPGSTSQFDALPISHALVLDPWLEPLPSPGSVPNHDATRGPHMPRILIINSEAFTLWKTHFARLQELIQTWRDAGADVGSEGEERRPTVQLLTLVRSVHISFSDFGVIVPFAKRDGKKLIDLVGTLALAFLENRLDEALKDVNKLDMELVPVKRFRRRLNKVAFGHKRRRLVGEIGDVIVHYP
ncbi:hypothetical protein CERSUDRAFT_121514 [Gelatoporia subvermispora B]|uniref:1-alkyl-2-acetylglycerophosphocholine esterase n=1 Tax=Ceriporiopsis subvermispora (strain B) TaxID=914234 RepID=M2PVT1_CERS8|nr:hypothetical protein CERSUDRAFT_121514 [Gelatoporia subvermispora B]